MISTLTTVVPIFALIFAGWIVRRGGVLGAHSVSELNQFVVWLALPALFFDIVAHTHWATIWRPGFILSFGIGSLAVFGLTVAVRARRIPLPDAAIDGLNAGYSNCGFMGFPLALVAFGKQTLPLTAIASIITVCIVFGVAILLIEVGLQEKSHPLAVLRKVALSLVRNPLLVAPALGAVVAALGLEVPQAAETFLKLLGGAASPCALVVIGLFLAERGNAPSGKSGLAGGPTLWLVAAKLLAQPAATWALAALVFRLPAIQVQTAVLLSALPTGTGPFMLAEFYRRDGTVTSNVILVSTVLSVLTVSVYLSLPG